jgi:hypothetical protein
MKHCKPNVQTASRVGHPTARWYDDKQDLLAHIEDDLRGKDTTMENTMLTSAELVYLRGLVEIDAHDQHKSSAKLLMELASKLSQMHEEANQQYRTEFDQRRK